MWYRNTTQAIKVLLLTIIYLSFIMSLLKRLVSKVLSMVVRIPQSLVGAGYTFKKLSYERLVHLHEPFFIDTIIADFTLFVNIFFCNIQKFSSIYCVISLFVFRNFSRSSAFSLGTVSYNTTSISSFRIVIFTPSSTWTNTIVQFSSPNTHFSCFVINSSMQTPKISDNRFMR